jgi:galactokinase
MEGIKPGIKSFAPGRICIFGEHQDYLHFPVVAAAIDLGIFIEFKGFHDPDDSEISIEMPDIEEHKIIDISVDPLPYSEKRDYLISTINVLRRAGIDINQGFDCEMHGTLPISAGASSSSAMVVSWITLLCALFAPERPSREQVAIWANVAEVQEFGEAGGIMDHFTSSFGGIMWIARMDTYESMPVPDDLYIVLGDSLQKKETVENIRALRANAEAQIAAVTAKKKGFRVNDPKYLTDQFIQANAHAGLKLDDDFPLVYAQMQDGAITIKGVAALKKGGSDVVQSIGALVTEHHRYLRDYLGISTDKVETLIDVATAAGAIGAKINGSGFGGTMFALCTSKAAQQLVAHAIDDAGGEAYEILVSEGARVLDTTGNTVAGD